MEKLFMGKVSSCAPSGWISEWLVVVNAIQLGDIGSVYVIYS